MSDVWKEEVVGLSAVENYTVVKRLFIWYLYWQCLMSNVFKTSLCLPMHSEFKYYDLSFYCQVGISTRSFPVGQSFGNVTALCIMYCMMTSDLQKNFTWDNVHDKLYSHKHAWLHSTSEILVHCMEYWQESGQKHGLSSH